MSEQLLLDLGDEFAPPAPLSPRVTIELDVVVCQRCTGHHPTERCPERVVCPLCTGAHPAAAHLAGPS